MVSSTQFPLHVLRPSSPQLSSASFWLMLPPPSATTCLALLACRARCDQLWSAQTWDLQLRRASIAKRPSITNLCREGGISLSTSDDHAGQQRTKLRKQPALSSGLQCRLVSPKAIHEVPEINGYNSHAPRMCSRHLTGGGRARFVSACTWGSHTTRIVTLTTKLFHLACNLIDTGAFAGQS